MIKHKRQRQQLQELNQSSTLSKANCLMTKSLSQLSLKLTLSITIRHTNWYRFRRVIPAPFSNGVRFDSLLTHFPVHRIIPLGYWNVDGDSRVISSISVVAASSNSNGDRWYVSFIYFARQTQIGQKSKRNTGFSYECSLSYSRPHHASTMEYEPNKTTINIK